MPWWNRSGSGDEEPPERATTRPISSVWSPAVYSASSTHSTYVSEAGSTALPVTPSSAPSRSIAARPSGRSGRQNSTARSRCASASTFTAKLPELDIRGRIRPEALTDTRISSGSSETEVRVLSVITTVSSPLPWVSRVTPVGNRAIAARNAATSGSASSAPAVTAVMSDTPLLLVHQGHQ